MTIQQEIIAAVEKMPRLSGKLQFYGFHWTGDIVVGCKWEQADNLASVFGAYSNKQVLADALIHDYEEATR